MDRLNIRTKNRKFETAKDLYGIFFDDSLWEMIRQSPVENFTVFLKYL